MNENADDEITDEQEKLLTDQQIEALWTRAEAAGDHRLAWICDDALHGPYPTREHARKECVRALAKEKAR